MRLLLNAAMVPTPGIFRYQQISRDEAVAWLKSAALAPERAQSYIGYPQTAEHINQLSGRRMDVPLNRAKCTMRLGDEAFVCKLAYRLENPATKGQPQPEDWEYGLLEMLADA